MNTNHPFTFGFLFNSNQKRVALLFLVLIGFVATVIGSVSTDPFVISSMPDDGAANVSVNTASIAANNLYVPEVPSVKGGVDNATITNLTVKLQKVTGDGTTDILGVVQGTGGGDAISFTPTLALEPHTKYKFVITDGVKSHNGTAFIPYEAVFTTGATSVDTDPFAVEFTKVPMPGTQGKMYSSLAFGPDGKFYALRLDGMLERFTVNHSDGTLSNQEEIRTLVNKYGERSAIGLTFDPASTATNLIAYVSHCSSGLGASPAFDGNISRLSGADLAGEQLVITKLPRSNKDHLVNSLAFGPDGALYFSQGSNSSMGDYDSFWQREESLLSAAVLRLDLNKLSGVTLPLDVKTTSDQNLINNAPATAMRMSDGSYNPYRSDAPLTIYASGVRNAYDLVWHSNGQLYVPTNGSAAGGNTPASVPGTRRPDGTFYNGPEIPATSSLQIQNHWLLRRMYRMDYLKPLFKHFTSNVQMDWLFRVNPYKGVGYYGHPNPLRGEYVAGRGKADLERYDASIAPDVNYRGASYDFGPNKSPNGAIEYKSNTFGGALKGKLLVCRFSGGGDIMVLEPGAMRKDAKAAGSDDRIYDIVRASPGAGTKGLAGMSGFANPLDLVEDVQTGNLYVIEFNRNGNPNRMAQITLLRVKETATQEVIASAGAKGKGN